MIESHEIARCDGCSTCERMQRGQTVPPRAWVVVTWGDHRALLCGTCESSLRRGALDGAFANARDSYGADGDCG